MLSIAHPAHPTPIVQLSLRNLNPSDWKRFGGRIHHPSGVESKKKKWSRRSCSKHVLYDSLLMTYPKWIKAMISSENPIDPTTRAVLALACCGIHRQRLILTCKQMASTCMFSHNAIGRQAHCDFDLRSAIETMKHHETDGFRLILWSESWVNAQPLRGQQQYHHRTAWRWSPKSFNLRQYQLTCCVCVNCCILFCALL